MATVNQIEQIRKTSAITYPDSSRYKCGFAVKSSSSNKIHKISYDTAIMAWCCSCPGACVHGQCKHMTACGLRGRKFGKDLESAKALGLLS